MFDEATILARLQNGEDVQVIANDMAAALNKVNKIYTDQKAKNDSELRKKDALQQILDLFLEWFEAYYEIDVEDLESDLKADQVIELIDSLKEYIETVKDLESIFGLKKAKSATPIGTKAIKNNIKSKSADEQINNFLKKMGW